MGNTVKATLVSRLRNQLNPAFNLGSMVLAMTADNTKIIPSQLMDILNSEGQKVSHNFENDIKSILTELEAQQTLLNELTEFVPELILRQNLQLPYSEQENNWFEEGSNFDTLKKLVLIMEKCKEYNDKKI